jgi:hypothetical protein
MERLQGLLSLRVGLSHVPLLSESARPGLQKPPA